MIFNASQRPLSESATTLPTMAATIKGWFRPITLGRVTQAIKDRETVEVIRDQKTRGVMQPFRPQQLVLKPEGERQWKWFMLHAETDLILATNDTVVYRGTRYTVMEKTDYSEYGYVQYDLVDAYTRKL